METNRVLVSMTASAVSCTASAVPSGEILNFNYVHTQGEILIFNYIHE
jgi:uncharacterized protein YbaA (DUF1428 family)